MLDEHWEDQPVSSDVSSHPVDVKADYFTLDPAYEHYELGVVQMEYKTVYGRPDNSIDESVVWAYSILALMLVFCGLGSLGMIGFIAMVIGVAIYNERTASMLKSQAEAKLQRLRYEGVLLDGTLLSFEIVREFHFHKAYKSARQPYAKAIYQFTKPDKRTVQAEQQRLLDGKWDRPTPTHDTPIRVLYVDPETYVML